MASTHPAPPTDRTGRLTLAALTFVAVSVFVWLVASLATAAFR